MKVIKNKLLRFFVFLLGFAGVLAAVAGGAIFVMECDYFYGVNVDSSVSYSESVYIKSSVKSSVSDLGNYMKKIEKKESANINDRKLQIYDYSNDMDCQEISASEFIGSEDIISALNLNNSDNSIYRDSYNNYSHDSNRRSSIPNNLSGSYTKISFDEMLSMIKKNAERLDVKRLYMFESGEIEIDKTEDEKPETDIYEKITSLLNDGSDFYINSENDNIYYIYKDDSFLIYNETARFIFRTGIFQPSGHQDLDVVSADYVYIDHSADDILEAYMYCSEEEAVYASLTKEEKEIVDSINNDAFPFIDNSYTAFSFNGKDIDGCNILPGDDKVPVNKNIDNTYDVSYKNLLNRIGKCSDVYISYDHKEDKITQWCKDEKGNKKDVVYLSEADLKGLGDISKTDFVIGMDLYSRDSVHSTEVLMYSLCQKVQFPMVYLALGILVFLASVIFLTWGEDGDKQVFLIDKTPYLVFFGILSGIIGIFYIIITIWEVSIIRVISNELVGFITLSAAILFILYLICAVMYLSVVRRIKSHRFMDGFIVVLLIKWVFGFIKGKSGIVKGNARLISFIAAFLIISCILCFIAIYVSDGNAFFPLTLLGMVDIIACIIVIKYMTDMQKIINVSKKIQQGDLDAKINTDQLSFNNKELGESINCLGDGLSRAIEASVREEKTKAELITNVSHDIKTPLTSIINYVDLLKREDIDNPKAKEYIEVLENKSERLKQLILDLIEASKTSAGNIELEMMNLNFVELLGQAVGEYEDKFNEKDLELVNNITMDKAVINADGRRIFRVIDNLLGNTYKYSKEGTRVYLNLGESSDSKNVILSIKNVSKDMLNISAEELTERFVRGDKSRSSEGSGLGLSIAKNLTELQGGTFRIHIDGDLFTAIISFPLVEDEDKSDEAENVNEAEISVENAAIESL